MKYLIPTLLLAVAAPAAAQPLLPDATFGNNGITATSVAGRESEAYRLVLQPDGKLIAAGIDYANDSQQFHTTHIIRYLANGQPDNSFGSNGKVSLQTGFKNMPNAMCLQPDGKILIAGNEILIVGNNITPRPFLARFQSNGQPDNSFGTNGVHYLGLLSGYPDKEISSLILLPGGKILVGGTVASGRLKMALVCLHADGSYDTGFGNAGLAMYTIETNKDAVLWDITTQNDGKIVLGGYSGNASFTAPPSLKFALARVQANGQPDVSFGTQGVVVQVVADDTVLTADIVRKVQVQPDGKIYAAGGSSSHLALVRYHADGTPDLSFGQNGKVLYGDRPDIRGILFRDNGKLLVGGTQFYDTTNGFDLSISAFNADGSEDTTVGPSGHYLADIYHRDHIYDLLMQPDGKVVTAGGYKDDNGQTGFLLTRYAAPVTTGIKGTSVADKDWLLYPNPASDRLMVQFKKAVQPGADIRLFSIDGRLLHSEPVTGKTAIIPLSGLAQGIYMVQWTNGTQYKSRNFVKQ